MNKNNLAIWALVLVVIIGALLYWRGQSDGMASESPTTASPFTDVLVTPEVETTGTTSAPALKSPTPNIEHSVVFSSGIKSEQQSYILASVEKARLALRADNKNFDAWIDLANSASAAGDTRYAIEILKFVSLNVPQFGLAECNMGTIYGYHAHDNVSAEAHYRTALAREPNVLYCWVETYQFFIDTDQTAKARAILKQGIDLKVKDYAKLQTILDQTP